MGKSKLTVKLQRMLQDWINESQKNDEIHRERKQLEAEVLFQFVGMVKDMLYDIGDKTRGEDAMPGMSIGERHVDLPGFKISWDGDIYVVAWDGNMNKDVAMYIKTPKELADEWPGHKPYLAAQRLAEKVVLAVQGKRRAAEKADIRIEKMKALSVIIANLT